MLSLTAGHQGEPVGRERRRRLTALDVAVGFGTIAEDLATGLGSDGLRFPVVVGHD